MTDTITTKLRESMVDDARGLLYIGETAFADLCDAIDAVHANLEAENESLRRELDRVLGEQEDRDGLIELPKDMNDEYIHIGDEMEGVEKYDSLKKVMGKVITVRFESDGIVDVAIQAWSSDGKSWHRAYLDPDASVYRHHHAPTVEDVLREFYSRYCTTKPKGEDDAILAEYAAKLQLADDAE